MSVEFPDFDDPSSALVSIKELAKTLGLSASWIRHLADQGIIPATRTAGGHRRFDRTAAAAAWAHHQRSNPGSRTRRVDVQRSLDACDEGELWAAVSPSLALPEPAHVIAQYITTEMVNNAIDHSRGQTVVVTAVQHDNVWAVRIADDGEGIFHHLATGLDLQRPLDALGELTKGKRTTDPSKHTGQGIFFSSKATDFFSIAANGYRITFDNERNDIAYGTSPVTVGTVVEFTVDPTTSLTIKSLFERFTDDDFRFVKTIPRVSLFEIGVRFVSRSEAKRLGVGLESFSEVELDFSGVTDVGQGFVDELFRVWAGAHPTTVLSPIAMNDAVEFMIHRSLPSRSQQDDAR